MSTGLIVTSIWLAVILLLWAGVIFERELDEINIALREVKRLREELRYIAEAKPSEWGSDNLQQFREWAQNRACAALKGGGGGR
jgi:hypothetical protein